MKLTKYIPHAIGAVVVWFLFVRKPGDLPFFARPGEGVTADKNATGVVRGAA